MVIIQITSMDLDKDTFIQEIVFAVISPFSHYSLLTQIYSVISFKVGSYVKFTWRDPCTGCNLENV